MQLHMSLNLDLQAKQKSKIEDFIKNLELNLEHIVNNTPFLTGLV